jgi:Uncharacterized protein conserved in bacteria (DUF2330)
MTPNEAVERAVPIFAKYPVIGFAELREMLRHEGGLAHEDIDQILEFVPLAFGRGFLGDSGVSFADEYVRTDVEGRERMRKKLADEPYFREAAMYAPLVMMKMGQEAFSAVALRSSEVRAINEALHAGSALSDLVASPPVLYWKEPGPGETAPSYQRQQPPASGGEKPWWKFWSLALMALLSSRDLLACAPAPHAGERITVVEESAVIIWEPATKTQHFIRRATFEGQASDFGFLVPTPAAPALARVDDDVFRHLQEKTTPPTIRETQKRIDWTPLVALPFLIYNKSEGAATTAARAPVEVLSTQKVGGYEAAILDATDAAALNEWLAQNGYATTPDLTEWLDAYVKQRWIISAFKIDKSQAESAQTSAVRMSFATERPFFPYREPASQRDAAAPNTSRLLRIFFVGPERVNGRIGGGEPRWPGQMHWSDAVRDIELAGVKLSGTERLTAFEDFSSPRPGTDDLFFERDADQGKIVPPPNVITSTDTTWVPADAVIAPVLVLAWWWRRRIGVRRP